MFFFMYLLGAFVWKYTYGFDIVWQRPSDFHARYPSITDIDLSQISSHGVNEYISERTLLFSQYYLLCDQLEKKYAKHQSGSLGIWFFFVALPLLLAARSAEFFSTQILNWIVVITAGVVVWVILSIVHTRFFKILPFVFTSDDFKSTLSRINNDDLLPGEKPELYANYLTICQHHRYLTSIEETVRLRYAIGKIIGALAVIFYILCIPQEL